LSTHQGLVRRSGRDSGARGTGYAVVRALIAGGVISLAVAACGSAAGLSSTSTAASSVPPGSSSAAASAPAGPSPSASASASGSAAVSGHGSPQEAETGLIKAELADDWTLGCSYLVPSSQAACLQAAQKKELPAFTGSAAVSGARISGSEALVSITGTMCSSATGCLSNSVPSAGLPTGQVTFAQAYGQVLSSTRSTSLSPVPGIEENGMWYINASL
jgi:hypothetical protein